MTAVLSAAGKKQSLGGGVRGNAIALIFCTTGSFRTHGNAVERTHGVLAHLRNLTSFFWQQTQTQMEKKHFSRKQRNGGMGGW